MKHVITIAFVAAAIALSPAYGDVIIQFEAEPSSPTPFELQWMGQELYEDVGSLGTGYQNPLSGDGGLPVADQDVPGLSLAVPIVYPAVFGGIPGAAVNAGAGTTTFYDVTLDIHPISPATNGLPANGAPSLVGTTIIQPLGAGDFQLWSTDPDANSETLLLEGTVNTAFIYGIEGRSTGATVSATVLYTGGAILDAMDDVGGVGEMSWSLLQVTEPLELINNGTQLQDFQANVVGQFSIPGFGVPEPVTMSLLAVGVPLLLLRRRRS